MKLTALVVLALLFMVILSHPARSHKLPIPMRQAAVRGLYDVQDGVLKEIQGDQNAGKEVISFFNKEDPKFKLIFVDDATIKVLGESYQAWHETGSSDSLFKFFSSLHEAKGEYVTPFEGTTEGFWKQLDSMASSTSKSPDKQLLAQAARSAVWIDRSLHGASIDQINPAARDSFKGLFELLGEYQLTSDERILNALTKDLGIIETHCQIAGVRADQETEFSFDTIDNNNNKVSNWTVFAFSYRDEKKRVGNPSTPVTGRLIPGEWLFFAERNGQRSIGEWHVVKNGRLEPPNIIIRTQ